MPATEDPDRLGEAVVCADVSGKNDVGEPREATLRLQPPHGHAREDLSQDPGALHVDGLSRQIAGGDASLGNDEAGDSVHLANDLDESLGDPFGDSRLASPSETGDQFATGVDQRILSTGDGLACRLGRPLDLYHA